MRVRTWRKWLGVVAAAVLVAGGASGGASGASNASGASTVARDLADHEVILNMFQWNWDSIAAECGAFLGPAGYDYVQVSPPQEHILGDPWWTAYQPVTYRLDSRLGDRAGFAAMVAACNAAGVGVIVDAVVNHMAAPTGPDTGWAGSPYDRFDFPEAGYGHADFHHYQDDCEVSNYQDRADVQMCHLLGLNDLATGDDYVQQRIAGYLNDLVGLGVAGFRIDAAKHIDAGQLGQILDRVSGDPYVVQEVIHGGNEPIQPGEYAGNGDVHEFRYARDLRGVFLSGRLADLANLGEEWGYLPGGTANVFIENHDTERNGETLSYRDGARYRLAAAFMMAWPYGTPSLYTGYGFDGADDVPPMDADGTIADADCDQPVWLCQHRFPEWAHMTGFRAATAGQPVTDWFDNGGNLIGFGRGDQGFFAANNEGSAQTQTFRSALPPGEYCDVIAGGCVTVNDAGEFTVTLPAGTAFALHA